MKKFKLFKHIGILIFLLSMLVSCNSVSPEVCQELEDCMNGEVCIEGICKCPDGFIGINCSEIDLSAIQILLDNEISPKVLFDGGVTLEDLYGKIYMGGILYYLNTTDGTGLIASPQDVGSFVWGCIGTSIPEAQARNIGSGGTNTEAIIENCSHFNIAAKSCSIYSENNISDWHLPSSTELELMYFTLYQKDSIYFANSLYWSSSENSNEYAIAIDFSNLNLGLFSIKKDKNLKIRAVRYF